MAEYPTGIKTFTNPVATNKLNLPGHATQHVDANGEITAIETELGTSPSGTYATLAVRIATVETTAIVGSNHATAAGTSHSLVVANSAGVATNAADILTNSSAIATNASDIATNAAGIATNVSDIATNAADILTNSSAIATNAADILTNSSAIATNAADILTNSSNIATNATQAAIGVDHSTANGSSHSYIDQDVTSGASPTFTGSNFAGIPTSALTTASIAEGDIFFRDGAEVTRLAIGASGEVLTVNAGATAPTWGTVTSITITSSSYVPTVTCAVAGSYTLSATNNKIGYYRVGDLCHMDGELRVTTASAADGVIRVSLPFTARGDDSGAGRVAINADLHRHGGNFPGQVVANLVGGNDYLNFVSIDATGTNTNITAALVGDTWRVRFGGTFVISTT